jgi:hypothetical protein
MYEVVCVACAANCVEMWGVLGKWGSQPKGRVGVRSVWWWFLKVAKGCSGGRRGFYGGRLL